MNFTGRSKVQNNPSSHPSAVCVLSGLIRVFVCTALLGLWIYLHHFIFDVKLDFNPVINRLRNDVIGIDLSGYDATFKLHNSMLVSLLLRAVWLATFHGHTTALSELKGVATDLVSPIYAATALAYSSSTIHESLERLALSLVVWVCYITSYGPLCHVVVHMCVGPFRHVDNVVHPWGEMTHVVDRNVLI